MNRTNRALLPGALLGLGVIGGLAVAAVAAAPRVEQVSPPAGSREVPGAAAIRIRFSQPMDEASVESRLEIEPRLGGRVSWEGTTLVFRPVERWPEGTTVVVRVAAGAGSRGLLPTLASTSWSFQIGGPRLMYLWPAGSPANLWLRGAGQDSSQPLTELPAGVDDFSLSSDRTSVVYSTAAESGDVFRLLDLVTGADETVVACPERTACSGPALSPGGEWLAFVRSPMVDGPGGQAVEGPSEVWLTSLGQPSPTPVGPADHVTSVAGWSPQGWLAYYDNTLRAIAVVDAAQVPEAEPFKFFPSELGDPPAWSPDGAYLLIPVIDFPAEGPQQDEEELPVFFSHLVRWDFATGESLDLSQEAAGQVEDASPVYSPDGEWIAFGRKHLDRGRWTLGRQLWIMRADGSEPHALTHEPDFHHSAFDWNAESNALVYMRFNQANPTGGPEIWTYDLAKGEASLLASGGYLPKWIP
jgi:hypothetical protein